MESRSRIDQLRNRVYRLLDICCLQREKLIVTQKELDSRNSVVRKLFDGVLPRSFPQIPNLKSSVVIFPENEMGNSFCDIFMTPFQKTAIVLYEISGNDYAASLIGSVAMMYFRLFVEKYEDPQQICCHVHRQLDRFIGDDTSVNAFLGIWDPLTNVITCSFSDCLDPIVFRKRFRDIQRVKSILSQALSPVTGSSRQSFSLDSKDKLILYTSGFRHEELERIIGEYGMGGPDKLMQKIIETRSCSESKNFFSLSIVEFGSSKHLLKEAGFAQIEMPRALLVKNYDDMGFAVSTILREMDNGGFPDLSIKQVKICVYEMISNAIRHGNREDFSKNVYVYFKVNYEAVTISVLDEGEGFDYNNLPNPLEPKYRYRDHGRGIFLIRHYMDEVSFNAKGNRILGRKYHEKRDRSRREQENR
ncbi:MAG: ATP-binding protein [Chitinispirillaceae bacterium]